jgi:hypothetical protein
MTRARGAVGAAALIGLLAGCGAQPAERPAAAPVRAAATGTKVKIVRSQFGRILADGRGQALYRFSRETGGASRCYGACATAWPPVPARGVRGPVGAPAPASSARRAAATARSSSPTPGAPSTTTSATARAACSATTSPSSAASGA